MSRHAHRIRMRALIWNAILILVIVGQLGSRQNVPGGLDAQTKPEPEFEVAAIKPYHDAPIGSQSFQIANGRLSAAKWTIRALFAQAYLHAEKPEIDLHQVISPEWMNNGGDYYDVSAVAPSGSTDDEVRLMLRKLLVDRFHLKFHTESRKVPSVAIVAGKNGPKFHAVTPDHTNDPKARALELRIRDPKLSFGMQARFREMTLAEFANVLSRSCLTWESRYVVDMTGLEGYYDLRIKTEKMAGLETDQMCQALPGLGLEAKWQDLPRTHYVLDSADRVPTEN